MTVRKRNFSEVLTPDVLDLEYEDCNFARKAPVLVDGDYVGIRIFPGDDTPRRFISCNLRNCILPPGSELIGDYNKTDIVDVMRPDDLNNQYVHTVYGKYDDQGNAVYKPSAQIDNQEYRKKTITILEEIDEYIKPNEVVKAK